MNAVIPHTDSVTNGWASMVRANREQVQRFRETPETGDFYAPMAAAFKADPHRTGEEVLDYLRSLVEPNETWLDIGGGAGRFALPLALLAREVTVVDPSDAMLRFLREGMDTYGIKNVVPVEGRWPLQGGELRADTAFISHVGYDVEDIGPFVAAMEGATNDRCIAVLLDGAPASLASPFWPAVHGEARSELPAAKEFLALLIARGHLPSIRLFERPPASYPGTTEAQHFLRTQLWVEPGSAKDDALSAEIERLATPDGKGIRLTPAAIPMAVIEWRPSS